MRKAIQYIDDLVIGVRPAHAPLVQQVQRQGLLYDDQVIRQAQEMRDEVTSLRHLAVHRTRGLSKSIEEITDHLYNHIRGAVIAHLTEENGLKRDTQRNSIDPDEHQH